MLKVDYNRDLVCKINKRITKKQGLQ